MIRLLAIDASLTATGWATITDNNGTDQLTTGTIRPRILRAGRWHKLTGEARIAHIAAHVRRLTTHHQTQAVCLEDYPYGMQSRAVTKLAELGGVIRTTLWGAGIPWVAISNSSIKLYATGRGNQVSKDDMVAAATDRLGLSGITHDEADAAWLHALVADAMGLGYLDLPPAHTRALTAVVAALDKIDLLPAPATNPSQEL